MPVVTEQHVFTPIMRDLLRFRLVSEVLADNGFTPVPLPPRKVRTDAATIAKFAALLQAIPQPPAGLEQVLDSDVFLDVDSTVDSAPLRWDNTSMEPYVPTNVVDPAAQARVWAALAAYLKDTAKV